MGKIKPYKEQDSSQTNGTRNDDGNLSSISHTRWTTLSTVFPEMLWLKPFYLP